MKAKLISLKNPKLLSISLLLGAMALAGTGCQTTSPSAAVTQTKASQSAMTPDEALEKLKAGNKRFVEGKPLARNFDKERTATASGQYPYAAVLSCVDSRCSSELLFDQGLGDIFSARVAGNVISGNMLGSMEFACKLAGTKLIAVVGHTDCGAIKGAVAGVEAGNLTGLLKQIQPAVDSVLHDHKDSKPGSAEINAVAKANVVLVMKEIRDQSPILDEMIKQGQIGLVGGMYDLNSGRVTFFE